MLFNVNVLFFLFNLFNLSRNIFKADTECPNVISKEDRRYNKNTLRVVQYNVEWLFIDYYTSSDCPGNGCTWKNLSDAQTHMNYVSEVIKKLNPDMINFCEIEGCDELNILSSMLNDTYLHYLKKGTDTSTGQNVGLLTKIDPIKNLYRTELKYNYPINGSNCGYTGPISSTGVSKHYITEFRINNIDIAFISAHLIAIPTDPTRCSQREAQAIILQTIINSYISDNYEIIMIGDFNDYDSDILDMNNDKPISRVLDILKGYYGTYSGEYELFSVAENITQNKRYSDWWDSDNDCNTSSIYDYSMIDHILVSSLLRKYISNVFIYHGYFEYCGKYNSDHYPVVVDFKF